MLNSELAEFSHDLRVPMTSIIAYLEMLEDQLGRYPDAVVADLLAGAKGASERMKRMLDQRMEIGRGEVQRPLVGVDLCQVASQLAADSSRLLDLAGATLKISWLPFVQADPDQMYCVLQNLLTNAVK